MAPPSVEALADELAALYRTAWEWVQAAQESLITDPGRWRRRARLRELEAQILALMDDVDVQAHDWLQRTYPDVYAAGGLAAGAALREQFAWSAVHRDAMAQLALDTFEDLLNATRHVRRTTKLLLRDVARAQTATAIAGGRTPTQAAAEMRRVVGQRGIWAVTYKDGSRHGLAEYADVVLRTKTAIAYNAGTLNQSITLGTQFFEVFDGVTCGWRSHDERRKANGLIVSAREAIEHPIAHPRCRRSFGARPDITSEEDASAAGPTTTAAQRADQADLEQRRAEALQRVERRRTRMAGGPGVRPPSPLGT